MTIAELIEKLKEYPENMEVVTDSGGMFYETEIDLEVVTATVNSSELNKPDEYTIYNKKDLGDYWEFSRVDVDVLLLY
jgi:hypothetical protein